MAVMMQGVPRKEQCALSQRRVIRPPRTRALVRKPDAVLNETQDTLLSIPTGRSSPQTAPRAVAAPKSRRTRRPSSLCREGETKIGIAGSSG